MADDAIVRRFTLEEALEIARRPAARSGCASRDNSDDWAGGTYEWAVEAASKGVPKDVPHIRQFQKIVASVRTARRPVTHWDVAGSAVDVGRFMQGEPDSMIEVVRGQRPSPMVRIAVERAASASVSVADIRATGSSVLAAISAMRTAGIPAEIWATFSVTPSWRSRGQGLPNNYSVWVKLQEAGRPINLGILAYWTLQPSALRRICFCIEEHEPNNVREAYGFTPGGGYGMPSNVAVFEEGKTFFDEIAPSRASEATNWLKEVLARRAGVTIRPGLVV